MLGWFWVILAISPFFLSATIALQNSQSLGALWGVLAGAIAGAVLIAASGIYWLSVLHRNWLESQAVGFVFLPIILPFFAYSGSVAGASLVALLSNPWGQALPWPGFPMLFPMLAMGLTVILAGLLPSAIALLPALVYPSETPSSDVNSHPESHPEHTYPENAIFTRFREIFGLGVIPMLAIGNGVISAWPGCLTQVPQMAEIRNVVSRVSGDVSGSQVLGWHGKVFIF